MPEEVVMFWFIHLVLGIVLPFLALSGCCRRDASEPVPVDATSKFL